MTRRVIILLIVCMFLCACGKEKSVQLVEDEKSVVEKVEGNSFSAENEEEQKENNVTKEDIDEANAENLENLFPHPLTGELLKEEYAGSIAAITINNCQDALPQYGISQADVLYEIETEGGITRMLAIFTDLENVESIGPVRSTRTFFNNLAAAYNAPFFHCGGNIHALGGAYDMYGNVVSGWKHIDQTQNEKYFFRDTDRYYYQDYAWEHTLFTTGEGILNALEDKGYNNEERLNFGLNFLDSDVLVGENADEVEITFAGGKTYTMTYNVGAGLYEGAEYGEKHIDAATGKVMTYRNVLVLFTSQYKGEKDLSYYDLIGSGEGYYACDGTIIPIQWSRESVDEPFRYNKENGQDLLLGVGNSYIAIVSNVGSVEYN